MSSKFAFVSPVWYNCLNNLLIKENPVDLEYYKKNAVDNIDKLFNNATQEIQKISSMQTITSLKIQEIKKYPYFSIYNTKSYKTPEKAQKIITEAYQESLKIKEQNQQNIQNNKTILQTVINVMKSIGLSEKEYYYKTSRSSKRSEKMADWRVSISQQIPTIDKWPQVEQQYKQHQQEITKWQTEIETEKQKKQREIENIQKEKQKERTLGILAVKYKCSADADENEILDKILSTNKYLKLAYYLEQNRIDWSDGPNYAEIGISNFALTSKQDKEIYNEIIGLISDWDGDGRCFRDCEHNYDYLYNLAKESTPDCYEDLFTISKLEARLG